MFGVEFSHIVAYRSLATTMSFSQEIGITVHNTTPTYISVINVPTGLHVDDLRHQIYGQATLDLGKDDLPEISSIVLVSSGSLPNPTVLFPKHDGPKGIKNNSVQEFANGGEMHAIVSTAPNLDLDQEAQDHPSYWPLMIEFLRGKLDGAVEKHRQDKLKEVYDLMQSVERLVAEAEVHKMEMAGLEQQINELRLGQN
jgi:hypothetical protein